jgi:hypothetical protein
MDLTYHIKRGAPPPQMDLNWDAPEWQRVEVARIDQFRPEGSDHRPEVQVRLLWSDTALHGIYRVDDRYVRCQRTRYFDEVWKDSCVEFFVQPRADRGYFNFEFNCGGAFLCCYITDQRRTPEGLAKADKLPADLGSAIQVRTSLPGATNPEIAEPIVWFLQFTIPFAVLEPYVGKMQPVSGERWRGNFFKCAEEVSHPHWASWSPVSALNFHLAECFGDLVFE